jgi:outer membrane protein assembly factor BamD (BamD/ComL family)
MRSLAAIAVLVAVAVPAGFAQKRLPQYPRPVNGTLGTLVRRANLYTSASLNAQQVAEIMPGRELVIVEHSGKWIRVFANTDAPDSTALSTPAFGSQNEAQPVSGWMIDKGIVNVNTPHGDTILFGAADAAEQEASQSNPPPGMAEEARLLYQRVYTIFPQSAWTPEAMYRAADIRWQLQQADVESLPSAHQRQSYLREHMDESEMRKIQKYFPHTKWAALAAFNMIDNKLCGDWQGSEKCPEQESDYYLRYVHDYPDSPNAALALYKACWSQAAAGDMWAADGNRGFAERDHGRAIAIAEGMEQQFPHSSYTARAAEIAWKVQQGIAIYGNSRE